MSNYITNTTRKRGISVFINPGFVEIGPGSVGERGTWKNYLAYWWPKHTCLARSVIVTSTTTTVNIIIIIGSITTPQLILSRCLPITRKNPIISQRTETNQKCQQQTNTFAWTCHTQKYYCFAAYWNESKIWVTCKRTCRYFFHVQ